MSGTLMGRDTPRIDGRAKVTGAARYPSDVAVPNPAHAYLVTSRIARGRILALHLDAARQVPGVLDILTHEQMRGQVREAEWGMSGYLGASQRPLHGPEVAYDGQIVAMVLADSYEAARDAAYRVRVDYAPETPAAGFGSEGAERKLARDVVQRHEDPQVGDADAALAAAAVRVDAEYATPTQHHNPIELFATTASWAGDVLTIQEASQFVHGLRHGVAAQLGLDPEQVRVQSPYIGGAFGGKGSVSQRTALVALAARRLGRPVKLVATREQGFSIATYRAETRQRVALGADRDGKLRALVHEGTEVTSRADPYVVAGTSLTARLYACPNVRTEVAVLHADRNTPGFMRSPAELPYMFALESAMDELAVALSLDPIELRRRNDTQREPIKGLPWTSRSLMSCYDAAAASFGWSRRNPRPGSMRAGEWRVGWGCATSIYPTYIAAAAVRVTLLPGGRARVATAGADLGTGLYTVAAMTAAEQLGLPLDRIVVQLGDTDLPPAPVAGGSNSTASLCNAIAAACGQLRDRLAAAAVAADGPLKGRDPAALRLVDGTLRDGAAAEPLAAALARLGGGAIEAHVNNLPQHVPPAAVAALHAGKFLPGGALEGKEHVMAAFGAQLVEVRVHDRTREIRVPRITGAFAAGRIVNPRTARSQLMGGMIWGIGSALHEATEVDPRAARYVNDNLAEYLIPVNADIRDVEVILVPEEDRLVNPLGIKGLGEIGDVGTAAAIANAVFHATGMRVRELPIRIESLLE